MTTLPLAGDLLAQYDNLPAIPRDDPLGGIINQLFAATTGAIARQLTVAPSGATAVAVNGGSTLLCVTAQLGGVPGNLVPNAIIASDTATVRASSMNIQDAVTGHRIQGTTPRYRFSASACTRCTNGVDVQATGGTLEVDAAQIEDPTGFALRVAAGNTVFWTGGALQPDKVELNAAATVVIASPGFRASGVDASFNVVGELSVGREDRTAESAFGGGDSHQRGLAVFTNTNQEAGTWADLTSAFLDDTVTSDLFPGVTAGNTFYVGGDVAFPNIKLDIVTAATLGGGALVFEYWDGSTWTAFDQMASDANTPYNSYGNNALVRGATSEQYRFNTAIESNWATRALNGTTKFWMRIRITSGITTSPSATFLKLGTNRAEINGDGFYETFGAAQSQRDLAVQQRLSDDLGGASPSNGSLNFSSNITITPVDNRFVDNTLDGFGYIFTVPRGLDTSRPIQIDVTYKPANNATGDFELELNFLKIQVGDTIDGSAADTNVSVIDTIPVNTQNVLRQVSLSFSVPDAVPGDFIAFSLFRDANAGNPDDTFAGNIDIVQVRGLATFWAT